MDAPLRYLLEVSYDGTCFSGSQIQGLQPTVQLALNQALSTLLRQPVHTLGASRTDADVHARMNFYHFDVTTEIRSDLRYKLNAILPGAVAVRNVYRISDPEFNARFSATFRSYRYVLYRNKDPFLLKRGYYYPFSLDFERLQETAGTILGHSQFESFSKRHAQTRTFNCTILHSGWKLNEETIEYEVTANRFLRGMVRALVGTQLRVNRSVTALSDFEAVIASRDCRNADFSVPGFGLYLEKIAYPAGQFFNIRD